MRNTRPVALVTGASRRIGAAIAKRLHAAGFDIALHHRHSTEAAANLADEFFAVRPRSCLVLWGKLEFDTTAASLVEQTLAHFGRLDVLVNNASSFFATPVGNTTAEQWDELFASNARAPFFLAQAAAPALRDTKGAIVNLADIHGESPLREHTVYCMAKAALIMLTRSLALELAPDVRVNAVAPGAVLWPEQGKPADEQAALLAKTPLARLGSPDDVAEAVRWLVQDATYCTGQVIRVDGGRSLNQ